MKRCKAKGCKRQTYTADFCQRHYYYSRRSRRPVKGAEVKYYANFLKRERINAKEYEYFKKIWNALDVKGNVLRHKKSVVANIMRKYLKAAGNRFDPV